MRNAIVENFGALIKDQLLTAVTLKEVKDTVDGLFDALLIRTRDTSSYVRSRVFQVVVKVLDVPQHGFFSNKRMKIAVKAYAALMDKTATVRKYALVSLQKLIQTHTFVTVKDALSSSPPPSSSSSSPARTHFSS